MDSASTQFALAVAWIAFWIGASIAWRSWAGKSIFPKAPEDALFVEHKASGAWSSSVLIVAVTRSMLFISPRFPFNLMFLPEIYRGEHSIDIADIESAGAYTGRLGMNVRVGVRSRPKPLVLSLKRPGEFVKAIRKASEGLA